MSAGSEPLAIGLLTLCALFAGRVADKLGLPRVAAYLLTGIAFSADMLGGPLGLQIDHWAEAVTSLALGVIAYLIGGSISVGQLRRLGRVIGAATLGEALGAMLAVYGTMHSLLLYQSVPAALPLAAAFGVLAISTAPAATLAVIHQYRTRGPMTNTLLGVVALDDALGVILFSVLLAAVTNHGLSGALGSALIGIGGAVSLGAVFGLLLHRASALFGESGLRLPLILSSLLLVIGIAYRLDISLLLSAMSLGFFSRLFARASAQRLFHPLFSLEEMIFILFFTLAGTHFDPELLRQHGLLIVGYVVARLAGKILGAALGTRLVRAPAPIVRWLGVGLAPQAGVAIGLALVLSHQDAFAESGRLIVNVILGSTLAYELLGPLATRLALQRSGELRVKRERHRHEGF